MQPLLYDNKCSGVGVFLCIPGINNCSFESWNNVAYDKWDQSINVIFNRFDLNLLDIKIASIDSKGLPPRL